MGATDASASIISAHSEAELTQWLAEAGFVCTYGEMRMDAPKKDDLRIHITAKKLK